MVAYRTRAVLVALLVCSTHVHAFIARAATIQPRLRPVASGAASPLMSANAARRASFGALGAGIAALTSTAASAADPRSTPWAYSTFLEAIETE